MTYFDTRWEENEDDIQGETPLEELQEYYPHVHIWDPYEETEEVQDEWEALEEEVVRERQEASRRRSAKKARKAED